MQTRLAPEFLNTTAGEAAEAILRRCVHCGFCTATCPTYQLLGDELDGPRGRIYLIKQVLEGAEPTRATQAHLDRCLTCRNCESTCPSGVQYGQLLEIGREIVDRKVPRPATERAVHWLLREGLTSPVFPAAAKLGQALRPLVPAALREKLPPKAGPRAHQWPAGTHPRRMLMLMGCVQPSLMPNINAATARVLDAIGIQTLVADDAGCCGAIRAHLHDEAGGLDDMRRNVDAWWPLVEGLAGTGPVEALVMNASGCGVMVKDYGRLLAHDPAYAERAARISALCKDISELLAPEVSALQQAIERAQASAPQRPRLAYHPPCTLQHGQQLKGGVETLMRALGFDIQVSRTESHLCCGSAGTYSLLQPQLSHQLRDRKLAALAPLQADCTVSGNIGCIQHLQSGTEQPVRHWVEVLDEALNPG